MSDSAGETMPKNAKVAAAPTSFDFIPESSLHHKKPVAGPVGLPEWFLASNPLK